VVIGKSGQLAHEIMRLAGDDNVHCLGRDDINILDAVSLATVLNRFQPEGIINASAYTAVDKAETDEKNA
jgi:dTDP-4-dehydrorhamnose reductase